MTLSTGEPRCADCNHEAREHGARGYGACRHGESLSQALGLRQPTDDPPCRCKRFRVRPRPSGEVFVVKLKKLMAEAKRAGFAVIVDSDSVAIRLVPATLLETAVDLRGQGLLVYVDSGCGGGSNKAGGQGAI